MRTSLSAIAAVLFLGSSLVAASAHDGAHGHAHLHEKKGEQQPLDCGCTTSWSTWYGEPTLGQPAPSSTTPAATYSMAKTTSATPTPTPSTSSSGSMSGGSQWAMCYSPYQGDSSSDSSCKSSEQVMSDISEIAAKGFKAVRIYATDCAQLENVGAAAKQYGLKMIIGIYIDSSGISSDAYSQLSDITSYFAGDYSLVEMALIGNEALFNGYVSAGELASFISDCKSTLKGAGYSGPVTTADTVASILANESELCGSIDALAANIHPFFNGNVQPEGACAFVEQQMQMLGAACGGSLPVYNSETGWPSQGPNYMNAVPGTAEQQAAIESLATCSCSDKNSYLSFENDMWKDDGTDSVEPYWGCVQLFS